MEQCNIVSKLQRFCIHDGPGIRTTVFLKGCPLRCAWCANPETQNPAPELMLRSGGCTLCGACAAACPEGALRVGRGKIDVDRKLCVRCGACARACPQVLPAVDGAEMSVEEVMETVLRDRPFYQASGGGMTLSGGEPLMQPEFSGGLLLRAKQAGISTCIETSLHAPFPVIQDTLPLLDYIYFDYKHSDTRKHRQFTGAGNELIEQNIRRLLALRPDARARIPVIPGFNDSAEDVAAICDSLRALGITEVELLRYHSLATPKYRSLGRAYRYARIAPLSEKCLNEIAKMFVRSGINANGL